jgi:hypothetical protein
MIDDRAAASTVLRPAGAGTRRLMATPFVELLPST